MRNAHFSEEVPVDEDLEFLEDEVDALLNEEPLVLLEVLVKLLEVSVLNRVDECAKLGEAVFLQEAVVRESRVEQLHRHQELQDAPLVPHA